MRSLTGPASLHARLPVDDDALQAALARALPTGTEQGAGGSLMVGRPSQLPGLSVHINPVDAGEVDFRPWRVAALVLIIDQEPKVIDPALAAAALGLTPAESRVAVLLSEGRTVRNIASDDRPLRKDRPLARAADFRETRRLPADRPRA